MLTNVERGWLSGAWVLIITCSVMGFAGIQAQNSKTLPAPGISAKDDCPPDPIHYTPPELIWGKVIPPTRVPSDPWTTGFKPVIVEPPPPPPKPPVHLVLPWTLYSGEVGMDRAAVAWKLQEPDLKAIEGMKRERSTPQAIVIHRTCDNGEVDAIFLLDPKETSFTDREVKPGHSYRYSVFVRGVEGIKRQVNPTVRAIDKDGEGAAEGRVPEWHKVVLMGGDREHAILNVESYNPMKSKWESRIFHGSPGQPIGETGWTLEGMRFDKFTLEAVLVDDRLEKRVISTKKK
jgi:hypothetical protein